MEKYDKSILSFVSFRENITRNKMNGHLMKKITAVIVFVILAGCGNRFSGLGSVDLQITSITFRDSYPATITGILPSGKPADFVMAADSPLIQEMRVICSSQEDTSGMSEANDMIGFPLFCTVDRFNPEQGSASIQMLFSGLKWTPDYSIRQENGTQRIYASARLENSTVETWQTDTLRFMDTRNDLITTATGRITVRQGTSLIPWWNAPAGVPVPIIRYGWPVPGKWNPLLAVTCPAMGRVESWNGQVYASHDTLFFPADSLIELDLSWQQFPAEYHCVLTAESIGEEPLEWHMIWPERLPRGASIVHGTDTFRLSPGESVSILYREVY